MLLCSPAVETEKDYKIDFKIKTDLMDLQPRSSNKQEVTNKCYKFIMFHSRCFYKLQF